MADNVLSATLDTYVSTHQYSDGDVDNPVELDETSEEEGCKDSGEDSGESNNALDNDNSDEDDGSVDLLMNSDSDKENE